MKIQIIGFGVVGSAQAFLASELGHSVYVYDVEKDVKKSGYDYFYLPTPMSDADITFICVPETRVEDVVADLANENASGAIAIKSTVPPKTTETLMEKYKIHLSHNPEFLREKYAYQDVLAPSRVIIGACCNYHGEILKNFYKPLQKKFNFEIYITTPAISEAVKVVTNNLRATVITFWNEESEYLSKLGIDIHEVAKLVQQGKTIDEWEGGKWGVRFFGLPFGGKCLPKDLNMTISEMRKIGLNPLLFEAVREYNEKLTSKGRGCFDSPLR